MEEKRTKYEKAWFRLFLKCEWDDDTLEALKCLLELVEVDKLKKPVKGSAKIPIELLKIREDEREKLIERAIKSALYNGIDNIPVEFIPRIEVDGDETGYYQGVLSVEFKFDIYPVSTEEGEG